MVVRKKIAEMITSKLRATFLLNTKMLYLHKTIIWIERDGYKSEPEQIFLTTGATQGITAMLELLVSNKNVGIMVPRPVYPLYTALLTLIGGKAIFYNLDAKKNWQIDVSFDVFYGIHIITPTQVLQYFILFFNTVFTIHTLNWPFY